MSASIWEGWKSGLVWVSYGIDGGWIADEGIEIELWCDCDGLNGDDEWGSVVLEFAIWEIGYYYRISPTPSVSTFAYSMHD